MWSARDLNADDIQRVVFREGGLFTILRDRSSRNPTYVLGDDLGRIEGKPQNQGPMSEALLLATLKAEGARLVSAGEAAQIRADHRVHIKNRMNAET